MTFVRSEKDADALTLTFVAEFPAEPARVWQVWSDPRQLERWWGPPTWPATFTEHDFTVGGSSRYHMTGPEGDKAPGWWQITAIDAPRHLEFDDGFGNADGEPDKSLPVTHSVVTLDAADNGTRMTIVSHVADLEALEQLVSMGMLEGMQLAMGQIDAVLAD